MQQKLGNVKKNSSFSCFVGATGEQHLFCCQACQITYTEHDTHLSGVSDSATAAPSPPKTNSCPSQPLSCPSTEHTMCNWLACPSCSFARCYRLTGTCSRHITQHGPRLTSSPTGRHCPSLTLCLKPSPPYDRTRSHHGPYG